MSVCWCVPLFAATQSALCRLTYLLDVHTFAEEEMDMNRSTLLLPKELDPIFIENERVRGGRRGRGG